MPFATSLLSQQSTVPPTLSCEIHHPRITWTSCYSLRKEKKRERMSTIVATSQIKQEHVKDENDTNNNNYQNEDNNNNNNNNNSSSSSSDNKYDNFFDEWKVGNWCWERDYNKYPAVVVVVVVVVVSLPANSNDNDNDNGVINSRSSERTIKEELCNDDVQKYCEDGKNANQHDNNDNEESNESVTADVAAAAAAKNILRVIVVEFLERKLESRRREEGT